jgi:hypothetical protein
VAKCYTTCCEQTIGCSIIATTSTSITTSIVSACGQGAVTNYDAIATWQAAGLPVPRWMQHPDHQEPELEDEDEGLDADDIEDEDQTSGAALGWFVGAPYD